MQEELCVCCETCNCKLVVSTIAGVNEALNETGYDGNGLQVRGTFRIYLFNASRESLGRKFRPLALQMTLRPIVAFSPAPLHPKQILIDPSALSSNVQLLTLEQTSSKVTFSAIQKSRIPLR